MHYVVLEKQLRKGTRKNIFIPITEKKKKTLTPGKIKVKCLYSARKVSANTNRVKTPYLCLFSHENKEIDYLACLKMKINQ